MAEISLGGLSGNGLDVTHVNAKSADLNIRTDDATLLLQLSCSDVEFRPSDACRETSIIENGATSMPSNTTITCTKTEENDGEASSSNQLLHDSELLTKRLRDGIQNDNKMLIPKEEDFSFVSSKRQRGLIMKTIDNKSHHQMIVSSQSTRTFQELEEELKYTQADLMHERERWQHFRKKAKRCGIWMTLLIGPEVEIPNNVTTTKCVEPVVDIPQTAIPTSTTQHQHQQLEQLMEDLAEQVQRREAVEQENQKLITEVDQLRVKTVIDQAAKMTLTQDQVTEHPIYKALYSGYVHERALNAKLLQLSENLKQELKAHSDAQAANSAKSEEAEKKRRSAIESMLHEKDSIIIEKDHELREMGHKLRLQESIHLQIQTEQQKVKEYAVLVGTLRRDLEKLRKTKKSQQKDDDLSQEFDNVQRAYDAMADQNIRLLQASEERERATAQLRSEAVRYQSVISILNMEKATLHQAMTHAEQVRQKQEEWIRRMQDVLHVLQVEEASLSHDNRTLTISNCRLDVEINQLRVKVDEANHESSSLKQSNENLTTSIEMLTRQGTAAQAEDRRKLAEEVQLLHKRLESVREKLKKQNGIYSKDAEVQELSEEITALRNILNCNVCGTRRKSCIITRCYHLFCNNCVDSNLKARKRKCPQCLTTFSESDVKQVWLS